MSHKATNWAVIVRGITPTQKVVLWHLADRHNKETGDCFPSQELLARDCEISRSSLNNQLKALEKAGLIKREQRIDGDTNRQKSTCYKLQFHRTKPKPKEDQGEEEEAENRVQDLDSDSESKNGGDPCPKNAENRVQDLDTNPGRDPGREPARATDDQLERFIRAHPKVTNRDYTAKLFCNALADGHDAEKMIEAAHAYRRATNGEPERFIKKAHNWLAEGRWREEAKAHSGEAQRATLRERAEFWAPKIKSGVYIPPSAISSEVQAFMLENGMVAHDELRRVGIS